MAKKISELDAPSLPLTGNELIEMSQSSTSVQVTVDELFGGGLLSFDGTTLTVLGDIVANDVTTSGDTLKVGDAVLKSSQGDDRLELLNAAGLYIGVEGSTAEGQLRLYGDDSDAGGRIYIYVPPAYDDTIDNYIVQVIEDNMRIGPSTDPDSLQHDGSLQEWQFRNTSGGPQVTFGREGTGNGEGHIALYGDDSDRGGRVRVYVAPAYDDTIDYYEMTTVEDDLLIGPDTDTNALIYEGNETRWSFTNGLVAVGTNDSIRGQIYAFGPSAGKDGGTLRLYNAAGYDSTIEYFQFAVYQDDLRIGPSNDTDAIIFTTGSTFNVTSAGGIRSQIGSLKAGADDQDRGIIEAFGPASGKDGGTLRLYNSGAYDTTIDYWQFHPYNGDWHIGPDTDTDAMRYVLSENSWRFGAAGGLFSDTDFTAGSGTANIGYDDNTQGQLNVFGSGTKDQGRLRIYNSANYDTNVDYYQFGGQNSNGELNIGPNTDTDSLTYEDTNGEWQFRGSAGMRVGNPGSIAQRYLYVGSDDEGRGNLYLYAAGSGKDGGLMRLYVSGGYDTTIDYYLIDVREDDLRIGPSTDFDALKYDGGTSRWEMSAADGLSVNGDWILDPNTSITADLDGYAGYALINNSGSDDTFTLTLAENDIIFAEGNTGNAAQLVRIGSTGTGNCQILLDNSDETGATDSLISFGLSTTTQSQRTVLTLIYDGLELADAVKIKFDSAPASDETGTGDTIPSQTVNENTYGIAGVLTIDSTTGNWIDADNTAEETVGMLAIAIEAGTGSKELMLRGIMRDDSWSWTPNDQLYVGTSGAITNTPPGSGAFMQVVGYAMTATTIYFNPSPDYSEIS